MKKTAKISIIAALLGVMLTPVLAFKTQTVQVAKAAEFTTTATGYTKASDVDYDDSGKYIANWGARGEDCVFLSTYAQSFYTGSYVYDTLSLKSGGSTQSNASSSALYSALKTLMSSKHTYQTSYNATKEMYRYTDCVSNDSNHISSFYSGTVLNGSWGSSPSWNREHTWPNSKGLGGQDENDIIMLRPTATSENSSRGNTAYGESSSYYDPNGEGTNVRGDCARIFLYVYVRWGNTNYAWGKNGVMESMNVLLKWMEEDPVDTWEMGRNDVVEDITGTRNVFVDYPEYAWLLFGKNIPDDMTTPSGIAAKGGNSGSTTPDTPVVPDKPVVPDTSDDPITSDTPNTSDKPTDSDTPNTSDSTTSEDGCEHEFSDWIVIKEPTEKSDGKRMRTCYKCGESVTGILPKTGGCKSSVGGVSACSALLLAAGAAWLVNKKRKGS